MDKKFLDMFAKFSTKNEDLELSKETLASFEKNVKKFLNDDDTDSSGDSGGDIPSITIFASGIAAQLIAVLHKMHKNCKNNAQKRKLSNLIANLKDSLENAEDQQKQTYIDMSNEPNFTQAQETTPEQLKVIERKLTQYGTFAINKGLDKNYFPTTEITVDTSDFDHLSREELVKMFEPETFYQLSKNQVIQLLQAVSNEYLNSLGVKNCAVVLENLAFDDKYITYGEYDPNVGAISINKHLINMIDTARATKDPFLPMQLLETVIHEAKHRDQFSKLNQDNLSEKDQAVRHAILNPHGRSYAEYVTSAEEIDARDAALQYLREMALSTGSDNLKQFYNIKKDEEDKKPKLEVSNRAKGYFGDVYGTNHFDVKQNNVSRKNFSKIIDQTLSSDLSL